MQVFPNLDLVKFVMAILVVGIHTSPLDFLGSDAATRVMRGIDCVAVPFFFISSAFLCFRGMDTDALRGSGGGEFREAHRIKNTMIKLLRLYLVWTAIYLPVTIFGDVVVYGRDPLSSIASFVRGVLVVGENFCSWPLWYLHASVVAFGLVYLLLRKGISREAVLFVAAVLLALGFAMDYLHSHPGTPAVLAKPLELYYLVFISVRNGLFEGMFYVAVGMIVGCRWDDPAFRLLKAARAKPGMVFAVALASMAGCIAISPDAHLPFCALFAVSVFLLSVRTHGEGMGPRVFARNASTVIYLVHMLFAVLFVYGISGGTAYPFSANGVSGMGVFAFSLAGSLALSWIVVRLSRNHPAVRTVFGI